MVEQAIDARGIGWAVRASAQEIEACANAAAVSA
jgi:hypothetical protein